MILNNAKNLIEMNFRILTFTFLVASMSCGESMTFEEQITNDITTKITAGKCKEFPAGTKVTNVKVGEIVDIGMEGMTDVSYEFDYEVNGEVKHQESAMLYIKNGSRYKLASMGSDCEL
jgi:hypothetical protein